MHRIAGEDHAQGRAHEHRAEDEEQDGRKHQRYFASAARSAAIMAS